MARRLELFLGSFRKVLRHSFSRIPKLLRRTLGAGLVLLLLVGLFALFFSGIHAVVGDLNREEIKHWLYEPITSLKIWQLIAIVAAIVFLFNDTGSSDKTDSKK